MSDHQFNPKLIAIFAIPVGLVFLALVASKKYVDVFESPAKLQPMVAHARKLGLPFTAQELRATISCRPEDRYDIEYRDALADRNIRQEVSDTKLLSAKSIDVDLSSLIAIAIRLASSTTFVDSRDFDSYEYGDVYSAPRQSTRLLVYKARYQAMHKDPDGAIETLALIPNLFKQMRQDPHIMGLLTNVGMQIEMCRGISEVSAQLGNDLAAQQKLLDLVDSDWSTQLLQHALKGEFYMQLNMLRNELPLVLRYSAPGFVRPEETKLDPKRPIQKTGLPPSTVGQGLVARLLDYYSEVYQVLTASDPASYKTKLDAISKKFEENSLGGRFVSQISNNATSVCYVYPRQESWKAITRWAIEIHRDYGGKFPASLPSRKDRGLGGKLYYIRTEAGFRVYSRGEDDIEDNLSFLEGDGSKGKDFGIEYPRAQSQ